MGGLTSTRIPYSNSTGELIDSANLTYDSTNGLKTATDIQTASDKAFYFGDKTTEGSWRLIRSGNNLVIERYESAAWVTKSTISA